MAYTSLGFDIFARDRASKTFRDVGDNIDKSRHRMEKFKAAMKVGAVVAGAALVKLGKDSVAAASDLNETLSKTEQIFGKKALPALEKFASGAAKSLGQSKKDALEAASTFGIFGKAAGLTGRDLTGFSTKFTKLASDMASFNNTSPEDAVMALGAAMRGESEPIRRYGVLLNEDAKAAEAVRIGLVKNVKNHKDIAQAQLRSIVAQRNYNKALDEHGKGSTEALRAKAALMSSERALSEAVEGSVPKLTQQQKTLAASSLIMQQTKDQQGDFARTSDGLANQQRILAAQFENVKAAIGQKLLPAVVTVFKWINDNAIPTAKRLAGFVKEHADLFKILAAVLVTTYGAWKVYTAVVRVATAVKKAHLVVQKLHLASFLKTTALLGAYTVSLIAHKTATIAVTVATKVWTAATWLLNAAWRANPLGIVVTVLTLVAVGLVTAYKKSETFRKIVDGAFAVVRAAGRTLWESLKAVWGIFKTLAEFVKDKVVAAFKVFFTIYTTIATGIIKAWKFVVDKVIGGVYNILNVMAKIPGPTKSAFEKARDSVGRFRDGFNNSVDKVIDRIESMKDKMNSIPRKITTRQEYEDKNARARLTAYAAATGRSLKSIKDEDVDVRLSTKAERIFRAVFNAERGLQGPGLQRAMGGPVFGPGSTTSDSIPAKLSRGEHVWTAKEVEKAGGHMVVEAIRRMALRGEIGKIGDPAAFALGGPVEGLALKQGAMEMRPLASAISTVVGLRDRLGDALSGVVSRVLNKMIESAPIGGGVGGRLTLGQVARGQAFARSQAGKPYLWGGVGPNGYDCSGFQSAVLNAALGRYPHSRLGTTGTMPWQGFHGPPGKYAAGWFVGSPGHMAGMMGGLGVESAGGVGVRVGSGARSVRSFSNISYYDGGGFLAPGVNLALNKSGQPEPVLTQAQWKRIDELIQSINKNFGRRSDFAMAARDLRSDLRQYTRRGDRMLNRLARLNDRRAGFEESVRSPFRDNDALFGGEGAFGLDALTETLTGQRRSARQFLRNLRSAKRSGLSGGLFNLLATSGNVTAARAFGGAFPMEISDLEELFRSRNQVTDRLGRFAGSTRFGDDQREIRRGLRALDRTMTRMLRHLARMDRRDERRERREDRKGRSGKRHSGGSVWPGGSFEILEGEIFSPERHGYIAPIPMGGGGTVKLDIDLYIDGRQIHDALLRVKRRRGGAKMGLD